MKTACPVSLPDMLSLESPRTTTKLPFGEAQGLKKERKKKLRFFLSSEVNAVTHCHFSQSNCIEGQSNAIIDRSPPKNLCAWCHMSGEPSKSVAEYQSINILFCRVQLSIPPRFFDHPYCTAYTLIILPCMMGNRHKGRFVLLRDL